MDEYVMVFLHPDGVADRKIYRTPIGLDQPQHFELTWEKYLERQPPVPFIFSVAGDVVVYGPPRWDAY